MTRQEKLMATDLWKSGEFFTAGRAAQSVSLTVSEIQTLLSDMGERVERRRVSGKAMLFRPARGYEVLPMRKSRFEWEGEYTPRYY